VRARRHVETEKPRFEASRRERNELAERFFAAVTDGDVAALVDLLAADVVVVGDGGGKVPQWATPIAGVDRVSRLLAGIGPQIAAYGLVLERHEVNGQAGAVMRAPDGSITNVWSIEIADGLVQTVRSVINPDKLRHLGPVADVRALLREHKSR